jgi:MscS family membrane protein
VQVYKPLEFLFLVAAVTTLAENMLPQVINIPKSIVQTLVRSTNCLTFVGAAARVVFNIKGRIVRESAWQLELKGDLTRQRRLEAIDKLMSLGTLVVASFFGVRALGMDVNSVLAIGGVGGVAVGLAGREILENLFTGLIILSSNPFEVGDEVLFKPSSGQVVEGIVLDVGWYRTTIRSFEREIFTIPNSVFTRNVVLNITRKNREWRFYEFLYLRLEDLPRVSDIVSDARKILRQDSRIIQKLHRRVFLHNVTREHCCIYISFYVEAANRDAFMAVKQDLLLAFIDCVQRNGAQLARNRVQLEMLASIPPPTGMPIVDIPELPQAVDVTPAAPGGPSPSSDPPSSLTKSGNDAENVTVASVKGRNNGDKDSGSSQSASKTSGSSNNISTGGSPSATASKGQGLSSSSSGSSSSQKPTISSSAIATSLSNSESATKTIISAISPDAIVGGTQDGATLMGSYDEDCF